MSGRGPRRVGSRGRRGRAHAPPLDFLAIGAARCGTTSLHEYLHGHPAIALPANKEAPFFTTRSAYARGWDAFGARLFGAREARRGRILGKVTPQYMAGSLHWALRGGPDGDPARFVGTRDPEEAATIVPRRIASHRPDIKLVAILRDPVERALSHYRLALLQGWEHRPPHEAFAHALQPRALTRARLLPSEHVAAYVAFGEYARVLGGYLSVFDPDQLCVVPFGDLTRDPDATVRRLLRFLGVDDAVPLCRIGRRFNGSADVPRLPLLDTRAMERRASESPAAQRLWLRMPPFGQRLVDRAFARLVEVDRRYNRIAIAGGDRQSWDQAATVLADHYRPWNERLRAMVGDVPDVTPPDTATAS